MNHLKLFEEFKNNKRILFLHGLDSKPFQDRIDIMKQTGAEVFSPHIDYRNQNGVSIANDIISKENITHIIGHSIGGLLTYYLSNSYSLPALMFNPAFGSQNDKVILGSIEILKNHEKIFNDQYAVVGMKDDVIPPENQLKRLNHATVWKEEDMGHRLSPVIFEKYLKMFLLKTQKRI